jgi:hypothetical protein
MSVGEQSKTTSEYYTTQGWLLDDLVLSGPRFQHAPRVSAFLPPAQLLDTIAEHEKNGIPLVIDGWQNHPAWPKETFTLEWLEQNAAKQSAYFTILDAFEELDTSI